MFVGRASSPPAEVVSTPEGLVVRVEPLISTTECVDAQGDAREDIQRPVIPLEFELHAQIGRR